MGNEFAFVRDLRHDSPTESFLSEWAIRRLEVRQVVHCGRLFGHKVELADCTAFGHEGHREHFWQNGRVSRFSRSSRRDISSFRDRWGITGYGQIRNYGGHPVTVAEALWRPFVACGRVSINSGRCLIAAFFIPPRMWFGRASRSCGS